MAGPLAGPDNLSMRRVFASYSQPIRFARFDLKSANPVLDQARALDPWHRSEGSWALGTRMDRHMNLQIMRCANARERAI